MTKNQIFLPLEFSRYWNRKKECLNHYKLWASRGQWQRAQEPRAGAVFVCSNSLGLADRRQDLPAQPPTRSAGSCLENQLVRGFAGTACIMCQEIQELLEAKLQVSRLVKEYK